MVIDIFLAVEPSILWSIHEGVFQTFFAYALIKLEPSISSSMQLSILPEEEPLAFKQKSNWRDGVKVVHDVMAEIWFKFYVMHEK